MKTFVAKLGEEGCAGVGDRRSWLGSIPEGIAGPQRLEYVERSLVRSPIGRAVAALIRTARSPARIRCDTRYDARILRIRRPPRLLAVDLVRPSHVRLMDGSRERWTTGGRSWSTDIPAPAASQYELGPQAKFFSSRQDVQKNIGRETPVILDTRSKLKFDGERFWPFGATAGAARAGHVPGAVHLPVELLRTEDGAFRSDAEMLREFRDRGFTTESDVITYCTIGNRASQAWYALTYLLGNRNARVYYGSWAEWGTTAEAPEIEP